jgi:S1-C subfamily serine protease
LRLGDVILQVGDRRVTTPGAVRMAVEFSPIGRDLQLSIARDGETLKIQARPTAVPDEPRTTERSGPGPLGP